MKRFRKLLAWMLSLAVMLGCFANAGAVKAAEGDTYNIIYKDDNENAIMESNAITTYTEGTESDLSSPKEKEGYVFEGWYRDAEFTTKITKVGASETGDITVYGKWVAQYTVTFDTKGGSTIASQEINEGEKVAKPEKDPEKTGSIFGGWYSDKDCTQEYDFNTDVTSNITLYAKWITQYTVTFDTKGGSTIASQEINEGEKVTRPEKDPEKTGSIFCGWYGDKDCTQEYDFNTDVTSNITLYAKWIAQYTVTFDTKGGSTIASQEINEGEKVARPEKDPEKTGSIFGGWYSDEGCTKEYDFNAVVTGDIKLYAKWIAQYTVTFDTKDGSPIESQVINEGNKVVKPEKDPEKTGSIFAGWYTDQNYTNKYNFDTAVTGNIILYAKWECTIVFKNDKGTSPDSITFTEGSGVSKDEMDKRTPTAKEGEIFLGWYDNEQNLYTEIQKDKKSMTLHAVWGKVYIKGKSEVFVPIDAKGANPLQAVAEDVDTGKYKITYTWKKDGDIKGSDAFCTPALSKLGSEQYYCEITVESGNFKATGVTSKVKVTGYQSKINVTLYKKVTVKSILGDSYKNYKISMKTKNKKNLKVDNKKGTLKANKYNKKKKCVVPVTVTIDGQKVTVQVTIKLPKPKIKKIKGKSKRYIGGVYQEYKISYGNIKGATKIVSYLAKKKGKFKKGPKFLNKLKGTKVNVRKGQVRRIKIVAYYGKGKSPMSKVVKLKG